MARRAWLDQVNFPSAQHHPIPAEQGAESAAGVYAPVIASVVPFDLVLLGIGEDGHTASLFPGQEHSPHEPVHPVHDAPKPPPDRVTLSRASLANTRELLVLVTGSGKVEAVHHWKTGTALPIASIHPPGGVDVLIDEAALGVNPG
jgi:6-phosphogluconolactonase